MKGGGPADQKGNSVGKEGRNRRGYSCYISPDNVFRAKCESAITLTVSGCIRGGPAVDAVVTCQTLSDGDEAAASFTVL